VLKTGHSIGMYLDEAGVMLALAVTGTGREHLQRRIEENERLWGQTWLPDPMYEGPSVAWQECKQVYRIDGSI
jgi:hypothetical protein